MGNPARTKEHTNMDEYNKKMVELLKLCEIYKNAAETLIDDALRILAEATKPEADPEGIASMVDEVRTKLKREFVPGFHG
jgi:hypothetical protein